MHTTVVKAAAVLTWFGCNLRLARTVDLFGNFQAPPPAASSRPADLFGDFVATPAPVQPQLQMGAVQMGATHAAPMGGVAVPIGSMQATLNLFQPAMAAPGPMVPAMSAPAGITGGAYNLDFFGAPAPQVRARSFASFVQAREHTETLLRYGIPSSRS